MENTLCHFLPFVAVALLSLSLCNLPILFSSQTFCCCCWLATLQQLLPQCCHLRATNDWQLPVAYSKNNFPHCHLCAATDGWLIVAIFIFIFSCCCPFVTVAVSLPGNFNCHHCCQWAVVNCSHFYSLSQHYVVVPWLVALRQCMPQCRCLHAITDSQLIVTYSVNLSPLLPMCHYRWAVDCCHFHIQFFLLLPLCNCHCFAIWRLPLPPPSPISCIRQLVDCRHIYSLSQHFIAAPWLLHATACATVPLPPHHS